MYDSKIGIMKNGIDTPALLLDFDIFENNLAEIVSFFLGVTVDLLPNKKIKKNPFLAQKQIDAGTIGITNSNIDEEDVMANKGVKDILFDNQIVDRENILQLEYFAMNAWLIVVVDDFNNIKYWSKAASKKRRN